MKNPMHHLMIVVGGICWYVSGQTEPYGYIFALGVIGMIWSLITG